MGERLSTLAEAFERAKKAEDEGREKEWVAEMQKLIKQKPPEPKIEDGRMVWDESKGPFDMGSGI